MADRDDVRRIALSLPGTREETDHFAFSVEHRGKRKGFVWTWNERVDPKRPKVPNPEVIAIRVAGPEAKEALLAVEGGPFFTEPHYNGYPAVLVRLPLIELDELEAIIEAAWRCGAGPRSGQRGRL